MVQRQLVCKMLYCGAQILFQELEVFDFQGAHCFMDQRQGECMKDISRSCLQQK